MLKAMTDKAFELGFKELTFTTKPEVMRIGYSLYKRLGYEELSEENGIVSMRIDLSKEYPYLVCPLRFRRHTPEERISSKFIFGEPV